MQGSTDSQSWISSVLPGAASCRNQCFTKSVLYILHKRNGKHCESFVFILYPY